MTGREPAASARLAAGRPSRCEPDPRGWRQLVAHRLLPDRVVLEALWRLDGDRPVALHVVRAEPDDLAPLHAAREARVPELGLLGAQVDRLRLAGRLKALPDLRRLLVTGEVQEAELRWTREALPAVEVDASAATVLLPQLVKATCQLGALAVPSTERLTVEAAERLLELRQQSSPAIPAATSFVYQNGGASSEALRVLLGSPRWGRLRRVVLAYQRGFDDAALATFLDNPALAAVEALDLGGCGVTGAGVARLAERGHPGISELRLDADADDVARLAASERLPSLRALRLAPRAMSAEALAEALVAATAGAPMWARLDVLGVDGLSEARAAALGAALGVGRGEAPAISPPPGGWQGPERAREALAAPPSAEAWRRLVEALDATDPAHVPWVAAQLGSPAWAGVPRPAPTHWVWSEEHRPGGPARNARGVVPTPSPWLGVCDALEVPSVDLLARVRPFLSPGQLRALRHRPGAGGALLTSGWRERLDGPALAFLQEQPHLEVLALARIDGLTPLLEAGALPLPALRSLVLDACEGGLPLLAAALRGPWRGLRALAVTNATGGRGIAGHVSELAALAVASSIEDLRELDLRGADLSGFGVEEGTDVFGGPTFGTAAATAADLVGVVGGRWPGISVRL